MDHNAPNPDWIPCEEGFVNDVTTADWNAYCVVNPKLAELIAAHQPHAPSYDDPLGRLVDPPAADNRQPPRRWKFRKVYHAPGYPLDPRNAPARALEAYVNVFAPQPAGTFDREPLQRWLNDSIN